MSHLSGIQAYLNSLTEVLKCVDAAQLDRFIQVLEQAREDGRKVYLFGNGGSGATASHITGDLNKGCSYGMPKRFRVICMNDNFACTSAYSNDVSYDDIFVEQLKNFLEPGEVVIGISGSGNSRNILRAIEYANANGAITVGMCGYDNGALEQAAQVVVHPHINNMQLAEDFHLILGHLTMSVLNAASKAC